MWSFVLFVLHVCSIAVLCACGIAVFCGVELLDINNLLCDICRCAFCFYVHLPLFLTIVRLLSIFFVSFVIEA